MRNKRLQGQVTAGRWTLPAAIFICTLCWVLTSVLLPGLTMPAGKEGGSVLWQSARTLLLPTWAEHLVSFLIYAAAGYFLIELNNRFGIIRMRASVQTAIYFLLVTVCPEMHLPSSLSVQEAFSFPSSPSFRCSGCLKHTVSSRLRSAVSAAH